MGKAGQKFLRAFLAGSVFVLSAQCALHAQQQVETKISGVIFANYEYVLSDSLVNGAYSGNFNSFDISRIYLNVEAKYSDAIKAFLQFENNIIAKDPWTGAAVANAPYVKQALLEMKDIIPDGKLMFGLIPNPWRGYEEGIWKHRFVSKISDDIEGLFPATDRGVRLNVRQDKCEYDIAIMNGEGTKGNETNKYKDLIGKLAFSPFAGEEGAKKGLKLNLYAQQGNYDKDQDRDRLLGGVSYESEKWNAMGTLETAKDKGVDADGFSIHTVMSLSPEKWVFARYDDWDPNTDVADDARSRLILGYGYKVADGVRAAIDYQTTLQQAEGITNKNQSALFYHLEIKF